MDSERVEDLIEYIESSDNLFCENRLFDMADYLGINSINGVKRGEILSSGSKGLLTPAFEEKATAVISMYINKITN